jgi:pyrroline-5-carboxylate reductase
VTVKLLVVGGGKMGSALLGGLLRQRFCEAQELAVVEPVAERRAALTIEYEGLTALQSVAPGLVDAEGGAVLAVKPDVAESACRALGGAGVPRVLSIVAGLNTARLEAVLPPTTPVVRAMANTPALVGAGVSAMSGGDAATARDLDWAESVLSAVGRVLRMPERQLDAVTALSGSGPAYFYLVVEALIDAGVQAGLARETSTTLVVETFMGSAKLLAETRQAPEVLRAEVTSPAGTTAAGIRALEARAVRSAFLEAVASAAERSRNLAR